MTRSSKSLLRKFCCGISMAALLLALSFDGSRPARAEPETITPLLEMMITPIIAAVQGVEGRLSRVEKSVSSFADSFTSQHVVAQTLCLSDEGGAQTCITKAELDSLLKRVAEAEIRRPSDTAEISHPVTEGVGQPPAESVDSTPEPVPTNVQGGSLLPDQEPEYTGTLKAASSGAAVVLHPEIEVSIVPGERSDD